MTAPAPVLAVTMGDPAGIGPEIIVKAARVLAPRLAAGEMRLLVIGHGSALDAACDALGEARYARAGDVLPALSLLPAGEEREAVAAGRMSAEAGRFAYLAVAEAVRQAQAGRVAAIVTAPLNKAALNLAGYKYAGHTDMLADLTGRKTSVMMLAHGNMRVSHVTTHVALEKVPGLITPERLRRTIDLTQDALLRMGIARPRIAVAALNPHAGEGGLFGRHDDEVGAPVVAQCVAEGMAVSGPVPGDTVFVKLQGGQYDAVVAMYHDQGHIPVKLLGFRMNPATGTFDSLSGVNITLGLPVIRTSVDHGTAFDIAGRGIANADSMVEAIEVALRMVSGLEQAA
jgi:4-hydroxythreonine-4-phosphate dehydrogenase